MKQKLNRKNQKRTIIIAENKNLNFNYLSIKENTKHRTEMENNKKKERNGENKMKKKQRQRRTKKKTQRRRKKREWTGNQAAHDTWKQFKKKKTRPPIHGATNSLIAFTLTLLVAVDESELVLVFVKSADDSEAILRAVLQFFLQGMKTEYLLSAKEVLCGE